MSFNAIGHTNIFNSFIWLLGDASIDRQDIITGFVLYYKWLIMHVLLFLPYS